MYFLSKKMGRARQEKVLQSLEKMSFLHQAMIFKKVKQIEWDSWLGLASIYLKENKMIKTSISNLVAISLMSIWTS